MQVTLDFVKGLYAKFIDWDLQMYDERTDTPAVAAKYVSFLLGLGGAR
jgi:phospholipid-translocating ATPase